MPGFDSDSTGRTGLAQLCEVLNVSPQLYLGKGCGAEVAESSFEGHPELRCQGKPKST